MVEGQNKNVQKGRKEKKKIKEEMGEAQGEFLTDAYHKERAKRTGRKKIKGDMNWESTVVVQTFKKEARYPGSYPLFRQVLTNIIIIINEPL